MNAYNPIATMSRLEKAGFHRRQAQTLADEMRGAIEVCVTQEQLEAALSRQTIRLSAILGSAMAIGFTVLGVLISISH